MNVEKRKLAQQQLLAEIKNILKKEGYENPTETSLKTLTKEHLLAVLKKDIEQGNYQVYTEKVKVLLPDNDSFEITAQTTETEKNKKHKELVEIAMPDAKGILRILEGKIQKPQDKTLNFLAICYGNATNFAAYMEKSIKVEEGLEGKWISIVRSNDKANLLFSVITLKKTSEDTYEANMDDKFVGEGRKVGNSLQVVLKDECKIFLFSFYVGMAKQPHLFEGTFSAIASNGSPIAGKNLLVRPILLPDNVQGRCAFAFENEGEAIWEKTHQKLRKIFENFDTCYFKIDSNKVHSNWDSL